MASSIHLILLSFLFFAAATSCSAFNVTQALGPLKQFSTFSNYLAQVGVVGMMTNLKNVTILAVDNANMGAISGKSRAEIKRVMTMHVIPEYYDLDRLRSAQNGTALIRTIYVLTGLARGKDGMLLVTKRGKGGRLSFASAILPRSKPTVTLLRSLVVPSRNVSIFHVSGVIATPPPVVSIASEGAGSDAAGRIAVSSKLMVRREYFPKKPVLTGGIKVGDLNEVFMPKTLKEDGEEEDLKTSEKAEEAPTKAPSKSPKKSPAKAPSPSNSTSGGKKGKSPASAPSSDSPAPAPSKKKSDTPSPAPSKSPDASKSPKAAKSSEASPTDSSGDSPAPSKSDKGGSSSDSPAGGTSPSPSDDSQSKSSPPAPAAGSESPAADSPSDDAVAPAPSGGAAPMSTTNVGMMMTVMALWALSA